MIYINKNKHLGYFDKEQEAAKAYQKSLKGITNTKKEDKII